MAPDVKVVEFPRNTSPEDLAEGFLEYAREGRVKWAVMVICEPDDLLRFEWSRLPSNFTANRRSRVPETSSDGAINGA